MADLLSLESRLAYLIEKWRRDETGQVSQETIATAALLLIAVQALRQTGNHESVDALSDLAALLICRVGPPAH